MELDRKRAAGVQNLTGSTTTTGQEPLIIDLPIPQTPGKHYILESASLVAKLATRGPSGASSFPPNTGLYLCPPGTPVETLADAVAGMNISARAGVLLPMGPPGANVATIGAGTFGFAFALTLAAGFKMTIPYGWFLRAIVVCQQGNAAPGPGTGSIGFLSAMLYQESDVDPIDDCR
jgi:hypothetical protein